MEDFRLERDFERTQKMAFNQMTLQSNADENY